MPPFLSSSPLQDTMVSSCNVNGICVIHIIDIALGPGSDIPGPSTDLLLSGKSGKFDWKGQKGKCPRTEDDSKHDSHMVHLHSPCLHLKLCSHFASLRRIKWGSYNGKCSLPEIILVAYSNWHVRRVGSLVSSKLQCGWCGTWRKHSKLQQWGRHGTW